MQDLIDDHVRVERLGSAGVIRLNRPRALNSLTIGMIRAIDAALDRFEADPAVATVVLAGEGERGLCAGGDIRALYDSGRAGTADARIFWREEFALTGRIARFAKPYVAFMDGITMGGGVGISTHGRHRIVTERTRLAMPETAIGYFPDVGASWFLPRMPGEAGTWIGLTGLEINAADAIYTGLADVQIPSGRLADVLAALADLPPGSGSGACDALFETFRVEPSQGLVAANRPLIDRAFSVDRMEDIVARLAAEPDAFAVETLRVLSIRSPKSLKLTLRLLREGRASAGLQACLDRELTACNAVLDNPDFYEGVRAAVIDKDRNPLWSPADLQAVTPEMLAPFFAEIHAGTMR
jgi:enoyl-CoA hydratase